MKLKSIVRNMLCMLLAMVLMVNPLHISVLADEVFDGVMEAVSGTFAENLTWTMEGYTLTISGEGDMAFDSENSKDMPWKAYKSKIHSIVIEEGVTSICNYAFFQHSEATEISLPDSLLSIGRDPFDSCRFDSITIPSNVENINSGAFQNIWIPEINVAEDNPYYASEDGVFFNKNKTVLLRYPTRKEDETYIVPESVREIADSAFYNTRCTEVTLSSGVTSIGNAAFFQSDLKSISIPASVTRMGIEVFANCWYLESISVDGSNKTYSSDSSGVWFNKNKSTLLLYPVASTVSSYRVPETVTAIEGKAFMQCSLSEITLPERLESIGAHSFYDCSNLTDVYFAGSEEQWNQIAINDNGNESLLEAEIHFDVPAYDPGEAGVAVTGIALSAPSTYLQMYVGKSTTLTATVFPENAENRNVIWTSSNPSIVSVEDGVLTANLTGNATITAETEDGGFTASCKVIVSVEDITHSGTFSNGIEWTFSSDGVLTISGIGDLVYDEGDKWNPIAPWIDFRQQIKNIVIEEGITSICNRAFVLHNQVQHISLPGTLVAIGEDAFEGCRWEHVTIPKSVTNIASSAFMDIWAADFTVESGNPYYSSEDGVLFNKDKTVLLKYPSLRTSEEYSIPESVTEIEMGAFRDARCTSVELPESVRRIGMDAFSSSSIQSIFIPENVMEIDVSALNFCSDLQSITVDPDNAFYSSDENGVLFNKAKTVLVRFPAALALDSYTVPETVEGISAYAFQNSRLSEIVLPQGLYYLNSYAFFACENLKSIELPATLTKMKNGTFFAASSLESVVIPSGIEAIGRQTFGECLSLKSVEIPVSVTAIERMAFDACESLTDIYYHGTEEQWNDITIDTDSNDPLFAASIHFMADDAEETVKYSGTCGDDLTWTLSTRGTLTISGTGGMTACSDSTQRPWDEYRYQIKTVIIEEGVTEISQFAFWGCENLEKVTLPDSLTCIRGYAFELCNISSITIPENVSIINIGALSGCREINVVPENTYFLSENGVLFDSAKETLLQYPILRNDESYTVPESVRWLVWNAFEGSALKTIALPSSLESVGNGPFRDCANLESFTVAEGNDFLYADPYGVLYDCSGKGTEYDEASGEYVEKPLYSLIKFPTAANLSEYAVLDDTISICNFAFADAVLTKVQIPDTVTDIRVAAFDGCEFLTDVYFTGTEEQWSNISINSSRNDALFAAKIHFNSTLSGPKGDFDSFECPEDVEYKVDGGTITVDHDIPCKVGYLSGDRYVVIEAVKNEDGTYSFNAPVEAKDVVMVISADIDDTAEVNSADRLLVARSLLLESHPAYKPLTPRQMLAADLNNDGTVNSADKLLIARSLLLESHPAYQEIGW